MRTFEDYDELVDALAPVEAIKVATWWNTAAPVWTASVLHGIPVYFVQDIETSYYPDNELMRQRRARLLPPRVPLHDDLLVEPRSTARARTRRGADPARHRPRELPAAAHDVQRRDDMVLALGRSNPLKNLPLTLAAWRALPEPRPELCLFGIEPELADDEPGVRYVTAPSDDEVNRLFNEATVFVQTSTHEGFCLPPLESMATGGAVVCTDAHGNRDFCVDGENCLMPAPDRRSVTDAMARLLSRAGAARAPRAGRDRDRRRLRVGTANRCARAVPRRGRDAAPDRPVDRRRPRAPPRPGQLIGPDNAAAKRFAPELLRCPSCRRDRRSALRRATSTTSARSARAR